MKVFKFFTKEHYYGVQGKSELEAKAHLTEFMDDELIKTEEIPESKWDKPDINVYEDNDLESEPFKISIRDAMHGEHPEQIFTNDYDMID